MNCAAEDIDLRAEPGLRIHRLYSDDPNGSSGDRSGRRWTLECRSPSVSGLAWGVTIGRDPWSRDENPCSFGIETVGCGRTVEETLRLAERRDVPNDAQFQDLRLNLQQSRAGGRSVPQ
jgi:hypothetical protein